MNIEKLVELTDGYTRPDIGSNGNKCCWFDSNKGCSGKTRSSRRGRCTEVYIASELRGWSSDLEGRAQLAVQKFADALDSIPLALGENAGTEPIDTMAELRAKQNKGAKWTGVDVRDTKVTDMYKQDVLEPLVVKEQIIKSATEAASMLLRIDDVDGAGKSKMPPGPPGSGGGMGGMGGGYGGDMDME